MSEAAELAELRARLAQLEARLAPAAPVLPTVATYRPSPEPQRTVSLATFRGLDGLPNDLRAMRQLATAVALGRGEALPEGGAVPANYQRPMAQLAALRARGLSWRDAMAEVSGLDAPSDGEVEHEARALRSQLRALWDGVLPVVAVLDKRLPGGARDLSIFLRRLLS